MTPVEQTQNEKQKDKVSGLGITKEVVGFYALPTRSHGFGVFYPIVNEMRMLAATADKARSLEPVKIGLALEGMEFEVFSGGQGYMRKDDHQFFQPMYIASFGELTNAEPFDEENTGWGWKGVETIETAQTVLPTTCKMTRPAD